MSTPTRRSRQPSGRPTGGQFAPDQKASSGLTLTVEEDEHLTELCQFIRQQAPRMMRGERHTSTWDAEDLAQDVIADLVSRARERGDVLTLNRAWARRVLSNHIVRATQAEREGSGSMGGGRINSANMAGWREFDEQRTTARNKLGRDLTTVEEKSLSEHVRARWHDPERRPTIDFHLKRGSVEYDGMTGSDSADRVTAVEDEAIANVEDTLVGPHIDRVLNHEGAPGSARRWGWNAICESRGIRLAKQGHMNSREQLETRRAVGTESGAAMQAVEAWDRGEDAAAVEAFFLPFSADDPDHRDDVVAVFRSMPERADDLWTLALAGAGDRNYEYDISRRPVTTRPLAGSAGGYVSDAADPWLSA